MQASAVPMVVPAAARHTGPGQSTPLSVAAMPDLNTYIVEDSPLIREDLIATLEELTPVHVVGSADNEAGALQWLLAPGHRVELVIIDLFLSGGSGLGVLRALAAAPAPGCLVVLSNYATPAMRRTCLELGADRVFDKSTEIDALIRFCSRLAQDRSTAAR
jgi:DNA-binding NarL/FixJ family response regulator